MGRLGCLLGAPRGVLGASWGVLGASWRRLGAYWVRLGASWNRRGRVLGRLGPSWGRLGVSCERLGADLGHVRCVFGGCWRTAKSIEKPLVLQCLRVSVLHEGPFGELSTRHTRVREAPGSSGGALRSGDGEPTRTKKRARTAKAFRGWGWAARGVARRNPPPPHQRGCPRRGRGGFHLPSE